MMTSESAPRTYQNISTDDKSWPAFCRGIIRNYDGWMAYTDESLDWNLVFERTIAGEIGESDRIVRVMTDLTVRVSHISQTPIPVRRLRMFSYELCPMLRLLATREYRISITTHTGSQNTDSIGLQFATLDCHHRDDLSKFHLSQTVWQNGRQLTSGWIS